METIESLQKQVRELKAQLKVIGDENTRLCRKLAEYKDKLNGKPSRRVMVAAPYGY